jgi:hypothetical protein
MKSIFKTETKNLLTSKIKRLGYYVESAIRHNKANLDGTNDTKTLARDITNTPFHAFGQHNNCRKYFCNGNPTLNQVPTLIDQGMWIHITRHFNRIAGISNSLIHNLRNNAAESFMSLYSKYAGGKRKNIYQRHKYSLATTFAGNSHRQGANPHYSIFKLAKAYSPHVSWKKKQELAIAKSRRNKAAKGKRKLNLCAQKDSGKQDQDYGPEAQKADMDMELYKAAASDYLLKKKLTQEAVFEIAQETVGQSSNAKWCSLRRTLITASNFYSILHKLPKTSTAKSVEHLLYAMYSSSSKGALRHGLDYEGEARDFYVATTGVHVEECGIFVDKDGMLGASPDGLIEEDGLLEIKCPYTPYTNKCKSITEAIGKKWITYLDNSENEIKLKLNSQYYLQIIGQLGITGRSYCDLLVYIPEVFHPSAEGGELQGPLHSTIRITADNELWSLLKPELERYFRECVLPEIIDPRKERSMKIRDTSFIVSKEIRQTLLSLKPGLKRKATSSFKVLKPVRKRKLVAQ